MPNPKANLDEVFTKIQPFLQVGYSFHKACVMALVPYSTVYPYFCDAYPTYDQAFHDRCERERNLVNIVARQNIIQAIKGSKDEKNNVIIPPSVADSFKWLERQEPDDFSPRQQLTDGQNRPLGGNSVVGLLTSIVKTLEITDEQSDRNAISSNPSIQIEPEANNPES